MKQKKLCLRGTVIPSFAPQNKRKTGMDFLYFAAGRYSVHSFSDRLIASENREDFEDRTAHPYSSQFSTPESLYPEKQRGD